MKWYCSPPRWYVDSVLTSWQCGRKWHLSILQRIPGHARLFQTVRITSILFNTGHTGLFQTARITFILFNTDHTHLFQTVRITSILFNTGHTGLFQTVRITSILFNTGHTRLFQTVRMTFFILFHPCFQRCVNGVLLFYRRIFRQQTANCSAFSLYAHIIYMLYLKSNCI